MSSRAAPPSELRWPRRLPPTCLADTFYGSWELIAKRAALEAHALHLNLNRVRYQQRCRECGLARKTRRATHMFWSCFGLPVRGATWECFCGCLEPPGGRDTSGRASVQHLRSPATGKGLRLYVLAKKQIEKRKSTFQNQSHTPRIKHKEQSIRWIL